MIQWIIYGDPLKLLAPIRFHKRISGEEALNPLALLDTFRELIY
jgi:hypothetical protein